MKNTMFTFFCILSVLLEFSSCEQTKGLGQCQTAGENCKRFLRGDNCCGNMICNLERGSFKCSDRRFNCQQTGDLCSVDGRCCDGLTCNQDGLRRICEWDTDACLTMNERCYPNDPYNRCCNGMNCKRSGQSFYCRL